MGNLEGPKKGDLRIGTPRKSRWSGHECFMEAELQKGDKTTQKCLLRAAKAGERGRSYARSLRYSLKVKGGVF